MVLVETCGAVSPTSVFNKVNERMLEEGVEASHDPKQAKLGAEGHHLHPHSISFVEIMELPPMKEWKICQAQSKRGFSCHTWANSDQSGGFFKQELFPPCNEVTTTIKDNISVVAEKDSIQ